MSERPTWADVKRQLEHRRTVYSQVHTAMLVDQEFLDVSGGISPRDAADFAGRYLSGLPAGFVPDLPPIAKEAQLIGTNQQYNGELPDVDAVLPANVRMTDDKRSEAEEYHRKAAAAILAYHESTNAESPTRDVLNDVNGLGLGVLVYPIDWEKWGECPNGYDEDGTPVRGATVEEKAAYADWEQSRRWPFDLHTIYPTNVYPDPYHSPPHNYIFEEPLRSDVPNGEFTASMQPAGTDTRKRVTWVCAEWVGQWIDGQPLHDGDDPVQPNDTGLVWAQQAVGGWGHKTRDGDFLQRWKGIIRDGRPLILMKYRSMNQVQILRNWASNAMLHVTAPDRAQAIEQSPEAVGPGQVWETDNTVQGTFLQPPMVADSVLKEDAMANALLEAHFGPAILRGMAQPGETAEGQRERRMIASAPYKPAKNNVEQLWGLVLADMLRMVKYTLRCPVEVHGFTIDPDKIIDGTTYNVNLSPPTADERAFEVAQDQKELDQGVITKQEYLRRRGDPNPVSMLQRVYVEKLTEAVLGSPEVQQVALQALMKSPVFAQLAPPQQAPMGGAPTQQGPQPPMPISAGQDAMNVAENMMNGGGMPQ